MLAVKYRYDIIINESKNIKNRFSGYGFEIYFLISMDKA